MFNPQSIDNIANRLAAILPTSLHNAKEDIQKNFRAILQSSLGQLDLLTQEEFAIQKAMLAKAQETIVTLEKRIEKLEKSGK